MYCIRFQGKSWLKNVSAFANGLGGSLFFGIDNEGNIRGLDDAQHVCEAINSRIRDYMDPASEIVLSGDAPPYNQFSFLRVQEHNSRHCYQMKEICSLSHHFLLLFLFLSQIICTFAFVYSVLRMNGSAFGYFFAF